VGKEFRMPEEVQNTQYPMAARIDANKDGVSNQKDFQTNEKKVAPRRMPSTPRRARAVRRPSLSQMRLEEHPVSRGADDGSSIRGGTREFR
jgi:hypothetical protein